MSFRPILRSCLVLLVILSFVSTFYLYLYPVFQGCAFPDPSHTASGFHAFKDTLRSHSWLAKAHHDVNALPPVRLLVLADPQLEGDSSLPTKEDGFPARLNRRWKTVTEHADTSIEWLLKVRTELRACLLDDLPSVFQAIRKRIDLFGNDYYLAHIYRTLDWWTNPSHVTVLGDLIGSQWVTDEEFDWRGWRYWNRVFQGTSTATKSLARDGDQDTANKDEKLDDKSWRHRLINIVGNHDIGYAGDISSGRIARFEEVFGAPNWDVRFGYPRDALPPNSSFTPTLHLVVLNSLNLDTPALSSDLQKADYEFLNHVIGSASHAVEDRSSFTLLLTHLPLYKPAGTCTDPPHFEFYGFDDPEHRFKSGGLQEQNHLSDHVSTHGILQGIYGMNSDENAPAQGRGRNGLILTGHDHEGCDTWHHIPSSSELDRRQIQPSSLGKGGWLNIPWRRRESNVTETGIREITLRSMMGEYGGNAGLLTVWFDFSIGEWEYAIAMCPLGTQHIWWGIHVLDIITVFGVSVWALYNVHCAVSRSIPRSHADKPSVRLAIEKAK
ncbi:MAG: hypothetical protein Q9160_006179 [Pyrenula sp. 1 TL-2023]